MMRISFILILTITCLGVGAQNRISPQQYIETYKDIAVREMLIYRIPASIKLAQAILESGSGNSPLAVEANNHFGIKCHVGWEGRGFYQDDDEKDECFRVYDHAEESYKDHSLFLRHRPRYSFLFNLAVDDYKGWANGLRAAGYATNPRYAELLIRQIELYELYYFDTISLMPPTLIYLDDLQLAVKVQAEAGTVSGPKKSISYSVKDNIDDNPVFMSIGGRDIRRNNRIKYIISGHNETVEAICTDLDVMPWQIFRYNDLEKTAPIPSGEIIYLQPKRRRAAVGRHTVKEGESIRDISQKYGIRMKSIYRLNGMEYGSQAEPGSELLLRKRG